jgi:hypothetical protein
MMRRLKQLISFVVKKQQKYYTPQPVKSAGSLSKLAEAIIGSSRQAVEYVFGLPPCAIGGINYLKSTIWYYSIYYSDREVGMVIIFGEGNAERVEFLELPTTDTTNTA